MNDMKKALLRVQTNGFALDEAILFLDTHSTDRSALEFYHKTRAEYEKSVADYVEKYGPLNALQVKNTDKWTWNDGCMPWEEQANVEI